MPREYQYKRLEEEQKYFRLLKLLPGGSDESLKCELEHREIQSPGRSFGAISYVWGTETHQPTIRCHDGRVKIPTNLKEALMRLRDKKNPKYLWTDSICIDQQNNGEKDNQILVMGSIYRQAEKVYVWLGNKNEEDAFRLLHHLYRRKDLQAEVFKNAAEQRPDSEWKSLSKVLKLDWFGRVWTLQEICLASRGTVLCGSSRMNWKEFLHTCRRLHATCKQLRLRYDLRLYRVLRTDVNFEDRREHPGFILKLVRERNCKVDIDRVRGILGHAFFQEFEKRNDRPFIKPADLRSGNMDYAVTKELLKLPEHLYALSLVQQDNETMSIYRHPSWVPRFKQRTFISVLADRTRKSGSWTAGGTSQDRGPRPNENVLEVQGLEVDCVKWQSHEITNDIKNGDKNHIVKDIWYQIRRRSDKHGHSEEQDLEEFCKVFYLNDHFANDKGSRDGYPTTQEQKANCFAYFEVNKINLANAQHLRKTLSDGNANDFWPDVLHHCRKRRFILTEKGDVGLAPAISEIGDKVCVFFGGQVPFLLRPGREEHRLCGECFFRGLMDGQATKSWDSWNFVEKTFKLV